MVISELLKTATDKLKNTNIPRLDAGVILSHILGVDRVYLAMHGAEHVDETRRLAFESAIQRRAKGEPVAYITGVREFMSLDFEVGTGVLIPRGDTETLCEYVVERLKDLEGLRIADLCCGSGCIGVSLAKYLPGSRVTMADISDTAIAVTRRNIQKHGVADRASVIQTDIMQDVIDGEFDVIVSNPPYIESGVIAGLDTDVRDYEPRLALDGGADGLIFYRRIAEIAPGMLKTGGVLAFEVGHTQADAVGDIMRGAGFGDINTICDIAGVRRVVAGRAANSWQRTTSVGATCGRP